MKTRIVCTLTVLVIIIGIIAVLGVSAAEPVFTDYSINKIAFSSTTEKDGVITGIFNKQSVVSGISITPNGTFSALIEGTQDGENWILVWEISSISAKTDFGLTHGVYANYTDKTALDKSYTYAWKQLRITVTSLAIASFSYELYGYETDFSGVTVPYDVNFGVNGVQAQSYYKDDRYKNIGNHLINQWGKGDVVSALNGENALTVKFYSPAAINGFAFAQRSGDTFYERWNNVKFQASSNGIDWVDLAVLPSNVKDIMALGDLAIVSVIVDNKSEYLYARILGPTVISIGVLDVYAPAAVIPETTTPETIIPITTAWDTSSYITIVPFTTAPVTTAAVTSTPVSTTDAATKTITEKIPDPDENGCKSLVNFSILTTLIPFVVLTVRKKKQ